MFNIYRHDKVATEKQRKIEKEKILTAYGMNREVLSERYKTRINDTLMKLNKNSQNVQIPLRSTTPNGYKRSFLVSTGFLPETDRVLEAESRNKWLDTTPNNKSVFKLRPRDKEKELHPQLKINIKSQLERVSDKITEQKEQFDTSAGQLLYKNYFGLEKPKFPGGKEVLSYYHVKTHFKTIESLALDLHRSTRNMSKLEIKKKYEDEKLGMSEGKIKQKSLPKGLISKEDVIPISEGLMEKFGYWKGKQGFLKKETSRFISSRAGRTNIIQS